MLSGVERSGDGTGPDLPILLLLGGGQAGVCLARISVLVEVSVSGEVGVWASAVVN